MYAETHAHTGFMEPAAHPKHNGNVTVVQPLYPTIGNTMRQSWWVFSGTVPKVSAGTVHGSTAWCWRELSPQTPTKKTAPLTTTHSWEEYIRTVEYRASGFMGVFGDISLRHLRCLCETSPATPSGATHIGDIPAVSAARHVMNVPAVLRVETKHMGTGTLCREAEHKGPVTVCVCSIRTWVIL